MCSSERIVAAQPLGHATRHEFLDTVARGLGMGASMFVFEPRALLLLSGPHRATAAQLGLTDPVDVVRDPNQQVQVEGPVLAVLEAAKAVEDKRFGRGLVWAKLLMEEQAMASEAFGLMLKDVSAYERSVERWSCDVSSFLMS